jgi:hypothetical protein
MAQRLAQHLMAKGLVSGRLVDEALKRAEKSKVGLDTSLLSLNAISETGVLQAISDVSGVRLVNLADFEPNTEAGPLMPYKMSKQLGVVPLSLDGQTLHVACAYPRADLAAQRRRLSAGAQARAVGRHRSARARLAGPSSTGSRSSPSSRGCSSSSTRHDPSRHGRRQSPGRRRRCRPGPRCPTSTTTR